ncbi:MAG TPA: TolC family protein [Bryobacteraceae bacterium]|nr:TolC family protein [Bryobacteraceae bacterium]
MRILTFLAGLLCAGYLYSQEVPQFPSPAYFRQTFSTPIPRVELQPPTRLEDFAVGDKLELSLRAYLELVLANNTDVAIQKVTVEVQRNAITRAFGRFDPTLQASFNATRANSPASDVLAGAATVSQLSQPANFNYQQTLESGTTYNVGFNASKLSTNSSFATFNPSLTTRLTFGFAQPLLRNRGTYITRLPVLIARSRLRASEYGMRDQLLRLLTTAESAYWDVVEARENLKVQEQALALRGVALKRAQDELRLGALPPLDIFQPQADYAAAEIQVSQARFRLAQTEDALRKQIGADLDPHVRNVPLELTETVLPPADTVSFDREAIVEKALQMRPDLRSVLQNLETDDLSIRSATNNLRPDLSLTGSYASAGRGGNFFQRPISLGDTTTAATMIPGGFGDALDQLFGFNFPTYAFGLTLRLPLRDRAAAADFADAVVQKRLNSLRARTAEQSIRLEVLNAISQVESSKDAVRLAVVARDLAQKNYEAEQKKYDLGTTVLFFVLDAQNRLTVAESRLLTESINYRRNLLNLLRVNGSLLEERGVRIQ